MEISFTERDLGDPEHPAVLAALARPCRVCGAEQAEVCRDIRTGGALAGRVVHRYRVPARSKVAPR